MAASGLTGQKVAVIGAGTEGLAMAGWLLAQGATVTLRDQRGPAELPQTKKLMEGGTKLIANSQYLEGLTDYDVIFRSPGVPFLTKEIQAALKDGVLVTSQTKLFFERCPAPIVGITGTKGKGTTATMLRDILVAGGQKPYLGGNIGFPPINFLDLLTPDDTVILELSSFQLQDITVSPHLAVVTNLGIDHLNHHADVEEYYKAKENILRYQTPEDTAVLNADDPESKRLGAVGDGQRLFFGHDATDQTAFVEKDVVKVRTGSEVSEVLPLSEIPVPGPHNLSNVLAAVAAGSQFGIESALMGQAIRDFKPLPYHLESVGEREGVLYVNDSYSTAPTSSVPAIESFDRPLILILGGYDKGIDFTVLAERVVDSRTKAVVLIGAVGPRIGTLIEETAQRRKVAGPILEIVSDIESIVPTAARLAKAGDVVLFSPATASLDQFKSYQERGKYFTEQVRSL